MQIIRTKNYKRKVRKLLNEKETLKAEDEIILNPMKWPIITGTGGIRKARGIRDNSGKSGGVRILYYFWTISNSLYLLDVYAKNEQENIKDSDKKTLKNIINELKGGVDE